MHRCALQRSIDVLADERALFRQALKLAVEEHVRIGQLAAALGREGEERARAALDVDPAVLARCSGQVVELVQLFLAGHDCESERLDHPRPLVKGQLAQCRPAHFARVAEHAAEIETTRSGCGDRRAVDRAWDFHRAVTRDPSVALVI